MSEFSDYEYRRQPGFDMSTFEGASQAIRMKTLVIHGLDPRAVEIPQAVAEYFGDEVYPGEIITDGNGTPVGSTRTVFAATNAGARAAFALQSVAAMDYIFDVKNVIPAVPKHIKLYGFFYEISSDKLTEVVRDIPA